MKRIAQARNVAPAALVREAVAQYVNRHGARALAKSLGAGDSGQTNLGERSEALLTGMGGTTRPRTRRDRR